MKTPNVKKPLQVNLRSGQSLAGFWDGQVFACSNGKDYTFDDIQSWRYTGWLDQICGSAYLGYIPVPVPAPNVVTVIERKNGREYHNGVLQPRVRVAGFHYGKNDQPLINVFERPFPDGWFGIVYNGMELEARVESYRWLELRDGTRIEKAHVVQWFELED